MEIEIVQTKSKSNYVYCRDPNAIRISIELESDGYRVHLVFKAYFGKNIKWANCYALGYFDGKPVLVPVTNGGYKTRKVNTSTAGCLRFNLFDSALDVFGKHLASRIRHSVKSRNEFLKRSDKERESNPLLDYERIYKMTGRIDDEQRVWIDIDEYDKEANQ